jgi:hypothetical protein
MTCIKKNTVAKEILRKRIRTWKSPIASSIDNNLQLLKKYGYIQFIKAVRGVTAIPTNKLWKALN